MSDKTVSDMIMEQAQKLGALRHEVEKSESELTTKASQLRELMASDDDVDTSDLEGVVKTLTDVVEKQRMDVAKAESRLTTLQDLEKASGNRAKAVGQVAKSESPAIIRRKQDPINPTDLLFESAAVEFVATVKRQNPDQIIEKMGRDREALRAVHGFITKSDVPTADTTTAGWARELVTEGTGALLESLEDISIAAGLRNYAQNLNFNGNESLRVPRVENRTGVPTEPAFIGENGSIPMARFTVGQEVINRYKIAAIMPATEELARSAIVDIVSLFSRELRKDYARKLDGALLDNVALQAGIRPAGLLDAAAGNHVITGAAIAGTAGGGVDAVIGDITKLQAAMAGTNMGERPVLIANRADVIAAQAMTTPLGNFQFADSLAGGSIMGIPVLYSNHVAQHTLIMVDAASLALAFDAPEFMVSREATVVPYSADATAPTMATNAAGTALGTAGQVPPDAGVPVVPNTAQAAGAAIGAGGHHAWSAFQQYSLLVRMIAPTSWARLRPNMIAYMSATTWT